MKIFSVCITAFVIMFLCVTIFDVAYTQDSESPNIYPTVAEDLSRLIWARCRFQMKAPHENITLRFYAYQYYDNREPLSIDINGNVITYHSDNGRGSFVWHETEVPQGFFADGNNNIIFRTNSPSTATWALTVEYIKLPFGSSKSTNCGKTWYSEHLGYNYSVVGNYAVRLLDGQGKRISLYPVQEEKKPVSRVIKTPEVKVQPVESSGARFEDFSFEKMCEGKELLDCLRDTGIETDNMAGGARLRRGELIKDENGNAQLNIDRTSLGETGKLGTLWWIGEQVSDKIWIKKELELKDTKTEKAYLMFFYQIWARIPQKGNYLRSNKGSSSPLYITINQTQLDPVVPDTGWRDRNQDWRLIEFPQNLLKRGINEIIIRSEKDSDWRFAYENSTKPNRSARSVDAGKTWDYNRLGENANDNGEYLIRFWLDRYQKRGMVWSLPISLCGGDTNTFMKRLRKCTVEIKIDAQLPPGTDIQTQVRFGTTLLPDESSWTDWGELFSGKSLKVETPGDDFRYMQWRAVLTTTSGLVTPVLSSVRLQVKGQREIFGDEKQIEIMALENPRLCLSSITPEFDSSDNEMLKELRDIYNLDEIIKEGGTEYQKLLRLAAWVRDFRFSAREKSTKHRKTYGIDSRTTHWVPNNALWALDMFSRGYGHLDRRYGSHCHDYNIAFVGCCNALGFVARPLIMTRMNPPTGGHSFPEVWSNEFGKWVYIDPYRGQYYIRENGIPINTMEIHEAQFDSTLFKSISTHRFDTVYASPLNLKNLDSQPEVNECPRGYESFGIWPRNNYMDEPAPYPIWDGVMSFRWDSRLMFRNPKVRFLPEFSRYSSRKDDLYWGVNQCFIQPQYCGDGVILLNMSHNMPNMKNYEVRFDSENKWTEYGKNIQWELHSGENNVEVRAVNDYGIPGVVSSMKILNKR